jgi:hypothetical protein
MKVFGYATPSQKGKPVLLQMSEITLVASPSELDQIIRFLSHAATQFAKLGKATDHFHVAEVVEWPSQWPDIIVKNPRT